MLMQFKEAWNKLRGATKSLKTQQIKKMRYDHFLLHHKYKNPTESVLRRGRKFPTAINIQRQSKASAIKCLPTSYRNKPGCVILVWRI